MALEKQMNANTLAPVLQELILKELQSSMELEWEEVKKSFIERIELRKAEVISTVVLYIFERMDMNIMGNTLTLRVETKKD